MSLVTTEFLDAIVQSNARFGDFEQRRAILGALAAIKNDTPNLTNAAVLERAKNSITQLTKIPVLKKFNPTPVDEDTCTFVGDKPTSDFVIPNYTQIGFAIDMYPQVHFDNYITSAEAMSNLIFNGVHGTLERAEELAATFFETSKDALTGITSNHFTVEANALNYTGDVENIYAKIPGILRKMNLNGPYYEVASTESITSTYLTKTFGPNNQRNYDQLLKMFPNTYHSNYIETDSNKEVRFIQPEGSLGLLNWVNPKGTFNGGLRVGDHDYWDTYIDPVFGFTWNVHYVKNCVDISGTYTGIDKATLREGWLFTLNLAFMKAYSSDTSSPVIKFTVNDAA